MLLSVEVVDILIVLVGISLLPLFIDTLNTFIPVGRLVHKYVSLLLVSVLVVLYACSLYYFFTLIIPFYLGSSSSLSIQDFRSLQNIYHWSTAIHWNELTIKDTIIIIMGSIFALWLWCNTIYSYISTIIHSPTYDTLEPTSKQDGKRYCNICKIIKEKQTHHCSQCGKCIPNMDHHCPFTANCVSTGKDGNFTYFFMFISYTSAGSAYAALTMIIPFYRCYWEQELSERCVSVGSMSLIFIPGVILFFVTTGFTLLHVFLIIFGKSTLEFIHWIDKKRGKTAPVNMDKEHENLKNLTKLHCSILEFLFPYIFMKNKHKRE